MERACNVHPSDGFYCAVSFNAIRILVQVVVRHRQDNVGKLNHFHEETEGNMLI